MKIGEDGRKKILLVVEAMGGGVFTYIVNLANHLVNKYDVYLAYATRPQTPDDYESYFDSQVHLIHVNCFTREISLKQDSKALLELLRLKKKINPDVIHLHSSKAGVLGRIAFGFGKTPLFYTPHGYSFLMEDASAAKRFVYRAIEKGLAKTNCTTVSCSAGEHLETLHLTKRAEYVDNGIELKEIDRYLKEVDLPKSEREDRPYTVFTLGRICYQKHPELFEKVAELLPDVRFMWVGDGEMKEELHAENIFITGWTERAVAMEYIKHADCFILPSRWEGLPISLLEAMYMKKPCVVSNIIGNHDVIQNDQNGYLCTTPEEFAAAIRNLQNPSIAQRICSAAYDDIINKYNADVMANSYSMLYEAALKKRNVK